MDKESIFNQNYRYISIGIVLIVLAIGFEGLGVTTIAPMIATDFHSLNLYGWIFTCFSLTQILGGFIAGAYLDRSKPIWPFLVAFIFFLMGLCIAAMSNNMIVFLVARSLQGIGAGGIMTSIYALISLVYPNHLKAKILAAFSAAYILPSIIGPFVAGYIAEVWNWRYVFWGIIPILLLAGFLSYKVYDSLKASKNDTTNQFTQIIATIVLTIGVGLLLVGLSAIPYIKGFVMSIGGFILILYPIKKLMPEGTLTLKKGLPSVLVSRGLLFASYLGTESYLILALTEVKGLKPDIAGLIVTSGGLSWSFATYLQSKWDGRNSKKRYVMILTGTMSMMIGLITIFWLPTLNIQWAIIGQLLTGFGIGLAHPTSALLAMNNVNETNAGKISSNIQFVDAFFPALVIGIAGSIIATTHSIVHGIMSTTVFHLMLIIISSMLIFRTKISTH